MKNDSAMQTELDKWQTKYQNSLTRHPECKEEFRNFSGMPLKPLYTPLDTKNLDYSEKLNFPGEYPYARGIYSGMYRTQAWSRRMLLGYEMPETFNRRQKALLGAGANAINLIPDNPYLRGFDSDQVDPKLIGVSGVPLNFLEDMEITFDGIPIDKVSAAFNDPGPFMVVAMFFALAEKQGIPLTKLRGTSNQSDCISHYVSLSMCHRLSLEGHLRVLIDHVKYCNENVPGWNPLSIIGQHIQQAGATPVQSLAFTLSSGIFFIDQCIKAGMDVDSFASRFTFFFDVGISFFEEIAKFRAGRRMWAKILKERFNAKNPRSMKFKFHAQTSGVDLTRQQPLNNISRATIQGLAAVFGGVQSLHVDAYDEAYQCPTEESSHIALMSQNIIAEESGVADVIDPLGGSYYVESLTQQIEEGAWKYIEKIDAMGGMFEAARQGYIQNEIGRSALEHQLAVDSGKRTVVGLNKYNLSGDKDVKPVEVKTNLKEIEKHVQRVIKRKKNRDQKKFKAALGDLRNAALDENANVFEAVIQAVKARVSAAEILSELRDVLGKDQVSTAL